jgi:hypothetical protein
MRKPVEIPALTAAEVEALDTLYRTTRDVRLRTLLLPLEYPIPAKPA